MNRLESIRLAKQSRELIENSLKEEVEREAGQRAVWEDNPPNILDALKIAKTGKNTSISLTLNNGVHIVEEEKKELYKTVEKRSENAIETKLITSVHLARK